MGYMTLDVRVSQSLSKGDSDDFFHFRFGSLHSFIIDYNSCVLTVDSPEVV